MKRFFLLLSFFLLIAPILAGKTKFAASKPMEPITFLGIPVDGPDKKFCKQLEKKGFVKVGKNSYQGWYDDMPSYITVISNNDQSVRRVVVITSGETVSRYNQLLHEFLSSDKYITDTTMCDYRPIKNLCKDKKYEAVFYALPSSLIGRKIKVSRELLFGGFDDERKSVYIAKAGITEKEFEKRLKEDEKSLEVDMMITIGLAIAEIHLRPVILTISDSGNVLIFYDNVQNQSNGSDL